MIVIKGRSEKSVHLENLIRKDFLTSKIVILDAIGVKYWADGDWATIWPLGEVSYEEAIKYFEDNYRAFKRFDWVGFYVNSDEESIKKFKELDRKYTQNFIATIQGDNGITGKYFI